MLGFFKAPENGQGAAEAGIGVSQPAGFRMSLQVTGCRWIVPCAAIDQARRGLGVGWRTVLAT